MTEIEKLGLPQGLVKNLNNLISSDRLPHAILLEDGNAEARDRLSLLLAAAFICEDEEKPCGRCAACQKAMELNHPDIIIADPEQENEKTFKIGAVRDIRKDAHIMPNEANKKIYILKSADKMNVQAQNALLKIIEEPPAHVRFILLCRSKAAMLGTVLSRVTMFSLGETDYAVADNAKSARASELATKLAAALLSPVEFDFMRLTAAFEKDKDALPAVLEPLQLIFRDAVIISAGSDRTLSGNDELCRRLAAQLPLKSLVDLVAAVDQINDCLNKNANKNLLTVRFCSVMRNAAYRE